MDHPTPGADGVRRALLESVIRLSCRDSVSSDMASVLGPLPEEELPSYHLTHELYGSTRMLLACLTREQLAQVGTHTFISPRNGIAAGT